MAFIVILVALASLYVLADGVRPEYGRIDYLPDSSDMIIKPRYRVKRQMSSPHDVFLDRMARAMSIPFAPNVQAGAYSGLGTSRGLDISGDALHPQHDTLYDQRGFGPEDLYRRAQVMNSMMMLNRFSHPGRGVLPGSTARGNGGPVSAYGLLDSTKSIGVSSSQDSGRVIIAQQDASGAVEAQVFTFSPTLSTASPNSKTQSESATL